MNASLIEYLLLTSSALFIAVNPLAVVPAFLAMTHNDSAEVRARIAVRACLTAGAVLALFALAGTWILRCFGLSLPAIEIAGSIVLMIVALDMIQADGPDEFAAASLAVLARTVERQIHDHPEDCTKWVFWP